MKKLNISKYAFIKYIYILYIYLKYKKSTTLTHERTCAGDQLIEVRRAPPGG